MFAKADAYEQFMGRWSRQLAHALIELAEVRDGDSVLDVGSGTGSLTFALGETHKSAHITGVDPSADFVNYAAQKTQDSRIHFEVGDAQRLKFPDATFDKTLSALVLNFVPDPARAATEMLRVTKRGGVVTAAVWDYGAGMQMLRAFWDEAIAADPSAKPRDEAHMPLCARGDLPVLWRDRGFQNIVEATLEIPLHFGSFDDYWAPFLLGAGPAGAYVATLSSEHRDSLAQRLRKRLVGDEPEDQGFELKARAWAVKGTVPG
jgi:SAM-dependent methyltransferase